MRVVWLLKSLPALAYGVMRGEQMMQPPAIYNDEVSENCSIGVSLLQTRAESRVMTRVAASASEAAATDAGDDARVPSAMSLSTMALTGQRGLARFLREAAGSYPAETLRSEVKARLAWAPPQASTAGIQNHIMLAADHDSDADLRTELMAAADSIEAKAAASINMSAVVTTETREDDASPATSGTEASLGAVAARGGSALAGNTSTKSLKSMVASVVAALGSMSTGRATQNGSTSFARGAENSTAIVAPGSAALGNGSAKNEEASKKSTAAAELATQNGTASPSLATSPSLSTDNSSSLLTKHSVPTGNASAEAALAKLDHTSSSGAGATSSSSSSPLASQASTKSEGATLNSTVAHAGGLNTSIQAALITGSAVVQEVLASSTGAKGLAGRKDLPDIAIAALVASLALQEDELLRDSALSVE